MYEKHTRALRSFAFELRHTLMEEKFEACWDDHLRPGFVSQEYIDWRHERDEALRAVLSSGRKAVSSYIARLPTDRDRLWATVAMIQLAFEAAAVLEEIGCWCEYPEPGPQMTATVLNAVHKAQTSDAALWPIGGVWLEAEMLPRAGS